MRALKWLLAAVAFAACERARPPAAPFDIGIAESRKDAVDHAVEGAIAPHWAKGGFVGLSVAVRVHGEERLYGIGEVRRGTGVHPAPDTLYEIGSVTKTFTSLLLAERAQAGAVKLSQPLDDFLPEGIAAPQEDGHAPTLEELATHTSGLPRLPSGFGWNVVFHLSDPYAGYTTEKLFAALPSTALETVPGEAYAYSNYGAALLGQALARREKVGYDALLTGNVLQPLGLADTTLECTTAQAKRLAPGYGTSLHEVPNWTLASMAPAGGLKSSAKDMLRYARFNLHPTGPLEQPLREVHREHYRSKDGKTALGLGWHFRTLAGETVHWHNGGTGGFRSMVALVPGEDVAVVVLSNSANEADDVSFDLLEALLKVGR